MGPSSYYNNIPDDIEIRLRNAISRGLSSGTGSALIFFRADDIGVPGKQFNSLIQLFRQYQLPLCLAVVPTWTTIERYKTLRQITGKDGRQWCWHQHGWLHRNHEKIGKKQEFGAGRPAEQQVQDLKKGWLRLQHIMGNTISPYFTPPWNRCSADTLESLVQLGFQAISRSKNAHPKAPSTLPDIQVNIDLHTRKETDPQLYLQNVLQELEQGIASGTGGIMIHHQRMNRQAFYFMALLLKIIQLEPALQPVLFTDFLSQQRVQT